MTETEISLGLVGEPEQQAAKLLHVVDTPVATMRCSTNRARPFRLPFRLRHFVYGVGGPCIQHHNGAAR